MNLKEFLAEEKELRKQRKLEKKQSKKNPKTKEEKFIKIGSIIVGILITFMALFRACSGLGGSDFSWYKLIGISDEMIIALEEPIDENTLLPNGKIDANDLDTCVEKLNNANANILENTETIANKSFTLTDKEIGALVNNMFKSTEEDVLELELLDFEIYEKNGDFYEKSIVLLPLTTITEISDLPDVYLTSESKIEVLDNTICILKTNLKINQIDDEINDEIIDLLNQYSKFKLIEISNTLVNSTINLFAKGIEVNTVLMDRGINFNIKG